MPTNAGSSSTRTSRVGRIPPPLSLRDFLAARASSRRGLQGRRRLLMVNLKLTSPRSRSKASWRSPILQQIPSALFLQPMEVGGVALGISALKFAAGLFFKLSGPLPGKRQTCLEPKVGPSSCCSGSFRGKFILAQILSSAPAALGSCATCALRL